MSDPDSLEEGFKVVDRRGRGVEPASPPRSDPQPREPDPAGRAESAEAVVPETPGAPELASLFLMLASSALVHLGEAADPVTQEIRKDLIQAQYTIDLLILLRDKTEGNRNPEETQLIAEILRDLQMRFVRAVNRS
jgi:hypothetical protein